MAIIQTARADSFEGQRGFTLAEILIVTVILALLASATLPRFIFQGEKANAAEAINSLGALQRGVVQFFDENNIWYPNAPLANPFAVCTNAASLNQVANDLGVDLNGSCNGGRWTYSIDDQGATIVLTASRTAADALILTYTKATGVSVWSGTGTFLDPASGGPGRDWPNLR